MRSTCFFALLTLAPLVASTPAQAQDARAANPSGWAAVRLELGGGWGHAFPGAPCWGDCGSGLRPGTGWNLQGFVRYRPVGFGIVHESVTFPWAIRAPSYHAPGASITNRATFLAFRAWLFEDAIINPYVQIGIGSASYTVNEPEGFCKIRTAPAFQGGVGLDVRIVRSLKYNIAWSTRTATPDIICDWEKRHLSGVPVPPEKALTAHTLMMGATIVIGDGWW